MKKSLIVSLSGALMLIAPALASAASLSVTAPAQGTTVYAKDLVKFDIVPSGFAAQTYQLTDSLSGTTASVNNIGSNSTFSWVPLAVDVGTHTLTITASDYEGNTATATQTLTVMPVPSVSITSIAPGTTVKAGSTLTFTASAIGFTNPTYIISDSFSGTTINSQSLSASGSFSWTPDLSQNGEHMITIYVSDSTGHNATVNQTIRVGEGPTLAFQLVNPGWNFALGKQLIFTVIPGNYAPTSFSLIDAFAGSTLSNSNVDMAGNFLWTPMKSDVGVHRVTFVGTVGAYGQSASTTQTITVMNADGSLPVGATVAASSTTTSSTNPAIAALLAQLAQLQAQLASLSSGGSGSASATATTPSVKGAGYIFKNFIGFGQQGTDVRELQIRLKALGFLDAEPTGYFGEKTRAAVKAFQAAHGLDQKGHVGPGTRAALNQ